MIFSETLSFKFGVVKHLLKEPEENAVDNWTHQNQLFFYHDESVRIKPLLDFVRFTAQICEILGTSTRLTRSKTLVQSNDDQFKCNPTNLHMDDI